MQKIQFRTAQEDDCAHLVLFADMATRRLTSHVWGLSAHAGQSVFEIGRSIIRNDKQHFTHFSNWRIAEIHGNIVGALNAHILPQPQPHFGPKTESTVLQNLNDLKEIAAGTCYLSAIALYPEHQGRGLGTELIAEAVLLCQTTGVGQISLMVGSFNDQARKLYERCGFKEWARRPFCQFHGSDDCGEWILMRKDLVQ